MGAAEKKGIKISDLARQAGVNRGTVQHYVREGLLPRPRKTSRNMAYYDESCVERIQLIKKLQNKHFLPLSVIKNVLKQVDSGAGPLVLDAQRAVLDRVAPPEGEKKTVEQASEDFNLDLELVQGLEKLGLIALREVDGQRVFIGPDLEVLRSIEQLKDLGFTVETGFAAEDLVMYKRAAEDLINKEVETFMRVVVSDRERRPGDVKRLAEESIDGATALFVSLRRKLIHDLLRSENFEALASTIPTSDDS